MPDSNRKYKVLFVDDESRILTALRSIFRREYEVFTAEGGEQALEVLANNQIDVIVSDQRMPNMLGNELLAKVHKQYPKTMRVLLTGFMDKEAIIKTINEGEIYRFINKPWNNDEIREIVAEAALASELEIAIAEQQPTEADRKIGGADHAMLMMEKSQDVRNQIRKFCQQQEIRIYGTQSIPQAVNAVNLRNSIGVAVVELPVDPSEAIQTISMFKKERPDLISIVLTDETDAQTAVDLINSGQVFRYLSKPLETEALEQTVEQAFSRHNFLRKNKQAQKRYKVDNSKVSFSQGIKSLFSGFGKSEGSQA